MGVFHSHIRLFAKMHSRSHFSGPVCSLGNQVTWGSVADIKHCISSMHSAFSMPAVTKPRSSRTFNMSSALKSFVQASQARGVNLDILPDPSKKLAFDRLIPNIFQPALKPFRPAMRFVYRHYRRLKARQSATIFYI